MTNLTHKGAYPLLGVTVDLWREFTTKFQFIFIHSTVLPTLPGSPAGYSREDVDEVLLAATLRSGAAARVDSPLHAPVHALVDACPD